MKPKPIFLAFILLWLSAPTFAQEEARLSLRLSRDFGTALGGRIQGTFSMHVTGPEELERVVFIIDGNSIGEDTEAPFRMQFRTEDFETGAHTLGAIGFLSGAVELRSNEVSREFIEPGESGRLSIILVVALLVLVVGGRFLAARIAERGQNKSGQPAITGPLGGAICPNCGRPYALHIWGVNLLAGRFDRCPHCRKWRFVRRASARALEAAAELLEDSSATPTPTASIDDEEQLRRRLDDSRFDDAT